jgi:hypothetical protein
MIVSSVSHQKKALPSRQSSTSTEAGMVVGSEVGHGPLTGDEGHDLGFPVDVEVEVGWFDAGRASS